MAEIIRFDLNKAETGNSVPRPPSYEEARERFMSLAREVGLDTRDINFGVTEDIVRVATMDDKHGKRSGWYVIHEERGLMYGALGNWKTDQGYVAYAGRDVATIDSELMRQITEKQEARRREAGEIRRRNAAEAAQMVVGLKPATPLHPYLQRKQIGPCGALQNGASLLLPISDLDGNVISTQEIAADGEKTFRSGCTSKGIFVIGTPTPTVVLCEGFATGASIHEATGMRVYVCFNAGTMASMAADIAAREGNNGGAKLVIAADNDLPNSLGQNIGYMKATQAAEAIGGAEIIMPPEPGMDWNDVSIRQPNLLKQAFSKVRPLFISWVEEDASLLPRRQWLYGTHYIRKFCSLTIAQPGLGKSTLALTECVAMATGRNLLGVSPTTKMKWIYFNAEDPLDEIKARVHAICCEFNIPQRELEGQLFIQSGRDAELNLATGEHGDLVEPAFAMIGGFIRYYGVDGITLDPLANMHDSPEDNELMRRLGRRLSRLADEQNCSVEIIHHTRKLNGFSASVEDARGGSALIGAVRTARVLNPMEPSEATNFGLDTHIDHFRIEPAGKNNLARPSDKAEWFHRTGRDIGNGDGVAIIRPWTPPDPFDGVSKENARDVQNIIDKMDPAPRESVQAAAWVGNVVASVLGLDVANDKGRIKSIVRTWLASGVLAVDEVQDAQKGRATKVVVSGPNKM